MVLKVERELYMHSPHPQFLPARDSNSQPFDWESDSLTIRPRLPQKDKEKEKEQREKERVTRGSSGGVAVKEEREKSSTSSSQSEDLAAERCAVIGGPKRKEMEQLKVVRVELKKAQESQREMKLLLDMYRSAPKEQRDKVQLMAAEKKAKSEAEELRQRVRELEERERLD